MSNKIIIVDCYSLPISKNYICGYKAKNMAENNNLKCKLIFKCL